MEDATSIQEMFNFGVDELNLYPFRARCIAAKYHPEFYPQLLETGHRTIDFLYSRSPIVSRQIRAGKIFLYFPERWLAVKEKIGLMASILDLHEDHNLSEVYIITGEPIIVSDFTSDMVRSAE